RAPPVAEFESAAYALIMASIVDVDPVGVVLGGPNRKPYFEAFKRAGDDFVRDRPLLEATKADVTNVLAGGQVQFNATRIMAHQAQMSAAGKRALAKPDCEPTKSLIGYIAKGAFEHGEMESPTLEAGWVKHEGGGKPRVRDCQGMLKTLQTGAPADVVVDNKTPAQPSAEAVKKAAQLMKVIDLLLATKRKGELGAGEVAM